MTKAMQPTEHAQPAKAGDAPSPWYQETPEDLRRSSIHDPEAVLKRPGHTRLSHQATELLGKVGLERALTTTPLWALITRDEETKGGMFLLPCVAGTPRALAIDYLGNGNSAAMKLTGPCRAFGYHIPKGHNLVVPVAIWHHSVHGNGLFLDFAHATERPIHKIPTGTRKHTKQQGQQQPPAGMAPEHPQ